MVYGYVLINDNKIDVEAQTEAIKFYASKHCFVDFKFIKNDIKGQHSSAIKKLYSLLNKLKENDTLLSRDILTLGRSYYQIIEVLKICTEKSVKIITVSDDKVIGENYDKDSLLYAFSLCSEVTRSIISKQTIVGLNKTKLGGTTLGRPVGSRNQKGTAVENNLPLIKELLNQGISKRKIARRLHIHTNTLSNGLNALKAKGKI